jgi:hypothetical protein
MAGFSAIIRYCGATKQLLLRDFGSLPWTAIDNTGEYSLMINYYFSMVDCHDSQTVSFIGCSIIGFV